MKIEKDTIVFDSGKTVYAYSGRISVGPSYAAADAWRLCYGHDGQLWDGSMAEYDTDPERLTVAELVEIADFQINLWNEFKTYAATLEQCT